jgi:hypothetical protein
LEEEVVISGVEVSTLGFLFFLLDETLIAFLQKTHRCSAEPQCLHSLRLALASNNDCEMPSKASPLPVLTGLEPFFSVRGFLESEPFSGFFFPVFPL